MAGKRAIKPYAMDIARIIRKDQNQQRAKTLPYIDLADVIAVNPQIVISPLHADIEYDEEELMFQVDRDTLKVDDVVVMGRDPGGQPIVIGFADSSGGPMASDLNNLKVTVSNLENTATTGNYLPLTGGSLTGPLVMDPGANITIPDQPVNPTDAVNKAYVDALFAICCSGGGGTPLVPTVTIDATDSTPCYEVLATDQVILVDGTLGPVTICLPANHTSGQFYEIKDFSGTAENTLVTVISGDGDLIELAASFVFTVNYQAATFISDGVDWFVF